MKHFQKSENQPPQISLKSAFVRSIKAGQISSFVLHFHISELLLQKATKSIWVFVVVFLSCWDVSLTDCLTFRRCRLLELERKRGSVCPARKLCEEEKERAFTSPFILPWKLIRAEWDKSSSLVENIIYVLNNKLKFFLLQKQFSYLYRSVPEFGLSIK